VNVFFDVDETIVAYDGSLRPHVREVFSKLKADGHSVYLWSGVGIRTDVVDRHRMGNLVTACFRKPMGAARRLWTGDVTPDFCVDDYPEPVAAFGRVVIAPYPHPKPDDELHRVYEAIRAATAEPAPPAAGQPDSRRRGGFDGR
jgi:phosphoglycolate phosphatase-like HAD superfamily hydrolase